MKKVLARTPTVIIAGAVMAGALLAFPWMAIGFTRFVIWYVDYVVGVMHP